LTDPPAMPPVLLHIGYHKTGSRWLRFLFFGNPQTGFGWVDKTGPEHPVRRLVGARPLEFDADQSRLEFEPLVRRLVDEGLSPVVSFERFSGNPFSGGYDSKEIADRLVQVFPGARVLVIVREQRSMIVSTYKQYVREGGALPPSKFIRPPTSRSMRVPWFDLRHFEYHRLLAYYRSLFGPESVLALTYEQFVADPRAFVAELASFAGQPLDDAPPLASPVFWRLGKQIDRMSLAPRRIVVAEEKKLRQTVAKNVGDMYVESNRRTAELTGIDLGEYGWMV